uniref:Uncharacterized protein n=1 Tax=Cucumis melo TaxID=3656 RepID=A0A9I9EM65_CUCME
MDMAAFLSLPEDHPLGGGRSEPIFWRCDLVSVVWDFFLKTFGMNRMIAVCHKDVKYSPQFAFWGKTAEIRTYLSFWGSNIGCLIWSKTGRCFTRIYDTRYETPPLSTRFLPLHQQHMN